MKVIFSFIVDPVQTLVEITRNMGENEETYLYQLNDNALLYYFFCLGEKILRNTMPMTNQGRDNTRAPKESIIIRLKGNITLYRTFFLKRSYNIKIY